MNTWEHFILIHSVIRYRDLLSPVSGLKEAAELVIRNNIKAEIIGSWLYCYPAPLKSAQLRLAGFWYSFTHHAWVYSGQLKWGPADGETLDEIKTRLGSRRLKNS